MKVFMKLMVLALTCSVGFVTSEAQITHQGNGIVCVGDLSFFTYNAPTGKSPTKFDWSFGDGFTSAKKNPTHVYKKAGKITAELEVTFSDGTDATETRDIEVLKLPEADFKLKLAQTCFYNNRVCFTNLSTPANSSQNIVSSTMVWGDGTTRLYMNPRKNDEYCHGYTAVDKFYVEMEVEDSKGCKSAIGKEVVIKPDVSVRFSYSIDYLDCEEARVCFTNQSSESHDTDIEYEWSVLGQKIKKPHGKGDPLCFTIKKSEQINVVLTGKDKNTGCADNFTNEVSVVIDASNLKPEFSKSVACLADSMITIQTKKLPHQVVRWYLNDTLRSAGYKWNLVFDHYGLSPGTYPVRCQISRGGCRKEYIDSITIHGPVARMKLFNDEQCGLQRRVFMVDKSEFVDTPNTYFQWDVVDRYGDLCTINRSTNQNKYRNCNTTIGWFGKHDYTEAKDSNQVRLIVSDKNTGCTDTAFGNVNLLVCGNCNPFGGQITICQGDPFLPPREGGTGNSPLFYSLDNGATWQKYGNTVGFDKLGVYDVGFIYEFESDGWARDYGDDSIQIIGDKIKIRDTFFVDDFLKILPNKTDTLEFTLSETCNPTIGTLSFQNGTFKVGERLKIDWGDSTKTDTVFRYETTISELTHAFHAKGMNSACVVTLYSQTGKCSTTHTFHYLFGHTVETSVVGKPCIGETICLQANIRDFATGKDWKNHDSLGTIEWRVNDLSGHLGKYEVCKQLDAYGLYTFDIIATSKWGCSDTTRMLFPVAEVRAGVKDESRKSYCDGLRTFYDSSVTVRVDTFRSVIAYHSWDFGTGNWGVKVRNPVMAFDGSRKHIQVKHAVTTLAGCTDTMSFDFRVLTSQPFFTRKDSIGCAPLSVDFTNLSSGADAFIWEVGDVDNQTYESNSLDPFNHVYNEPGEFFVRLIGIDSFFNTNTRKTEYCHTIYPPLKNKGVRILVLPSAHEGIEGPDTICIGSEATFINTSSFDYDLENWNMGDGTTFDTSENGFVQHIYDKNGTYTVSLDPVFLGLHVIPRCISEITKTVVVTGVLADFDIDPDSEPPRYQMINTSEPITAKFEWDFGDYSSDDNFSEEVHPIHNYGLRTGTYNICLTARLNGCVDEVCKEIKNDYTESIETYNVFTPNDDGLNDVYVLQLSGQAYHDYIIYNRWGEVVFESKKNATQRGSLEWNGRVMNSGPLCPAGTYFYVVKYAFNAKPDIHYSTEGVITLIR